MPTIKNGSSNNEPSLGKEKKADEIQVARIYNDEEATYFTKLATRLETAKRIKSQPFTEFKNKTYYEVFNENEKIANTHLPAKKNDDDVIVSAGTVESKLDSLLSNINNLNLDLEVFAFDKEKKTLNEAAIILEDIIHDTRLQEPSDGSGDEEKKVARQRELLKQGTVFVQEEWLKKWEIKKTLQGNKEFDGKFRDSATKWSESLELVFNGPSTSILYGPNVYLGDITKFYMDDQPFVFVVIHKNYWEAATTYGKFEMWQYVHAGKFPPDAQINAGNVGSANIGGGTIYDNKWRLTDIKQDQVEIILYQDKPNDEFQIIINGVMMLPVKFPLSAVSAGGQYNIAKQIFKIINSQFAYGESFVGGGSIVEIANLIDEMLKLFVLKTRRSFTPPYINTSGRVISGKALSPGHISMGISQGELVPLDQLSVQGITNGEVAVFERMNDLLNKNTISEQFTGQQGKSGTTATEVAVLQRQAKLTLGLAILSCALLEKKIGYLRLWNILCHWFDPIDTRIEGLNDARKYVNVYRTVNRTTNIEGQGLGERRVVLQDGELPDPRAIRAMEIEQEKVTNNPIRYLYLNPEKFKRARITWFLEVTPKEKETSSFLKMLFKEMLGDVLALMQLGSKPNMDTIEEEFARVWGKSRNKLFLKASNNLNAMGAPTVGGGNAPTPQEFQGRANANGGQQMTPQMMTAE